MKKIVLLLLIIAFFNSSIFSADLKNKGFGSPETYEISPIAGLFIFEDNSYDNSLMLGVRALINVTKKYAIEGELGFSPSSFNYGIFDRNSAVKDNLKIYSTHNYSFCTHKSQTTCNRLVHIINIALAITKTSSILLLSRMSKDVQH